MLACLGLSRVLVEQSVPEMVPPRSAEMLHSAQHYTWSRDSGGAQRRGMLSWIALFRSNDVSSQLPVLPGSDGYFSVQYVEDQTWVPTLVFRDRNGRMFFFKFFVLAARLCPLQIKSPLLRTICEDPEAVVDTCCRSNIEMEECCFSNKKNRFFSQGKGQRRCPALHVVDALVLAGEDVSKHNFSVRSVSAHTRPLLSKMSIL